MSSATNETDLADDLHRSEEELQLGLDTIRQAPTAQGRLELIVRRPAIGEREILEEGYLDLETGLRGDNWSTRGSRKTEDGSAHPEMQLNLMGARTIALIAGGADAKQRWKLAGDQLFVDLDLSQENLPPGTRLEIGAALIEVTAMPHLGCKKFVQRFGLPAMHFVNSPLGRSLRLRGLNAKVIRPGPIVSGDPVRKC